MTKPVNVKRKAGGDEGEAAGRVWVGGEGEEEQQH